ncbi:fumarylacetoacetate hydrolase family protein [Thalassotalea ponticola]|uniref:fumarylacetoacetate hydrolase family protein n=1 Tax=Thalassotalea ponticola TaxID=1523392 RepID=UPI0025B39A72|nr:fumarylacetoacetate hydrolase family protein [Thalassotalea ponticola]MDN3653807.1 fumarylacetoacetate hydrolase family protein [Thalassotalea ponticola]
MSDLVHKTYADALYKSLCQGTSMPPISAQKPELTIDDAYQISLNFLEHRLASGQRVIGKKIGVTSKAVQDMLNVHQPDFGFLTDAMQYQPGDAVSLQQAGLIQPRAEGEIAFYLGQDLNGPGITKDDVINATQWVAPCFEIVDSRIHDWNINIVDTVADNASCGVFVVSDQRVAPDALDLASVEMTIWKNNQVAGQGVGAAVQGHPAQAVAWLANTLGEYGITLNRGDIILSGALAPLLPVQAGDKFTMTIEGLGDCSIDFVA